MLTTKKINALGASGRQHDYSDGRVPGLKLRVSQSGTKTFALWYRFRSKQRRIRVGRYPEIGLAAARARAQDILRDIEVGIDPHAKRRDETLTLKSVEAEIQRFVRMHVQVNLKSAKDVERILNRDIVGAWRSRDVRDISHEDVLDLIDELQDEHTLSRASLAFRHGRKFFNWLVDRRVIDDTPFRGLKDPGNFKSRDRVLRDEEVAALWHATSQMDIWGPFYRLLILSGKRRGEVATALWDDFDHRKKLWIVPRERTKKGKQSVFPITKGIENEVADIPRNHAVIVFPSQLPGGDGHMSGFSKAKSRLEKLSGVTDFRIHDIRRTVATRMAELGVGETTIERLLDHEVRVSAVAPVYNRYTYIPEMRAGLKLWNKHLRALIKEYA